MRPWKRHIGKSVSSRITHLKDSVVLLDLKKTYGWYDFTVTIRVEIAYSRRYAGRAETGKASISDPVMGSSNLPF